MQEKNIVNSILLETLQPAPKSVNLRGSETGRERVTEWGLKRVGSGCKMPPVIIIIITSASV